MSTKDSVFSAGSWSATNASGHASSEYLYVGSNSYIGELKISLFRLGSCIRTRTWGTFTIILLIIELIQFFTFTLSAVFPNWSNVNSVGFYIQYQVWFGLLYPILII